MKGRTKEEILADIAAHILICEEANRSSDPKIRHDPALMKKTLELIDESEPFRLEA